MKRCGGSKVVLLAPESAERLIVVEGASRPRISLRFSNYRRFSPDVKVIEEPDE